MCLQGPRVRFLIWAEPDRPMATDCLLDSALPQARTIPCHILETKPVSNVTDVTRVDKDLPTKINQSLFQVRSLRSFKLNPAMTTSHRLSDLSRDPMSHLEVLQLALRMQRLFHALHQQLPTTNHVRFKLYFSHFLRHWCFLTSSLSKAFESIKRSSRMSWPIQRLFSFRFCLKVWHHAGALTCSADTQNRELPTMALKTLATMGL